MPTPALRKLGLRLHHHFTGEGEATRIYLSDLEFDEEIIAELFPGFRKPGWRLFDGSVAEWKTAGAGTPWTPKNFIRMLIYRGTRDWTRIYESALMLGVYTPDEMLDLNENARALRSRNIGNNSTLADRLAIAKAEGSGAQHEVEGFDRAHVTRETAALSGEPAIEQETSADASPAGDGSDGDPEPHTPPVAAGNSEADACQNPSASESEEGQPESSSPAEAPNGSDAAPSSPTLSTDDRAFLIRVFKTLAAAVGPDVDILKRQAIVFKDEIAGKSDLVKAKASTIRTKLEECCGDEPRIGTIAAGKYLAGLIGIDEKELV
jgi:hypothetical protein